MEILKAKETDIDDIERIYEHIHDEEENGRAVIGISGEKDSRRCFETE